MKRGEAVNEIGTILRGIADRVQAGETDLAQNISDAEALRHIAASCEGEGAFILRMHRKRGGQKKGLEGLENRLHAARMIADHCSKNDCSIETAASELDGLNMMGAQTLENAAHEFGAILKLPEDKRELMLYMKRQEALGRVNIRKVK